MALASLQLTRTHLCEKENLLMPDIMHLIKIHAAPEQIYKAFTTADGVRNWWTPDADLDSDIGGTGEFRFYERRFIIRVGVQELRRMTHLVGR
jgi:uncharacterized protein YndB with AHSA1/START domain